VPLHCNVCNGFRSNLPTRAEKMENVIGGKLKLKKPLEGAIKWV
jgi:hypothetical protein